MALFRPEPSKRGIGTAFPVLFDTNATGVRVAPNSTHSMKKAFYLFLTAIALCGCHSDEGPECPVSEIKIPQTSYSKPIKPNDIVTIRGNGFEADCRIFLRGTAVVRAATQTEVQAEVTEVTTSSVSFRAPEVYGTQSVVLAQSGGRWTIGELTFARQDIAGPDLLSRRISRIYVSSEDLDYTIRFAYDAAGRISEMRQTDCLDRYPGADTTRYDGETIRFAYGTNRITMIMSSDSCTFRLSDGRATDAAWADSGSFTFSYDSNGYISQSTWKNSDSSEREEMTFAVTSGNLTEYTWTYYESGKIRESETYAFTIDSQRPNNLNIDLYGIDCIADWELYANCLLGINGPRLQHLPKKISLKENGRETAATTYRYTTDGEYISRIDIHHEEIEDGEEYSHSLEFVYEE